MCHSWSSVSRFSPTLVTMLTLDPITLYYWNFVMIYRSKQGEIGPISTWASEVQPGAPPSNRSKSSMTKTHASTLTGGTTPPSSIIPSSSNSVLTKSLTISEPTTAQGLYWQPPTAHPLPKEIPKKVSLASTIPEIIDDNDERDLDYIPLEDGPVQMEAENLSENVEF